MVITPLGDVGEELVEFVGGLDADNLILREATVTGHPASARTRVPQAAKRPASITRACIAPACAAAACRCAAAAVRDTAAAGAAAVACAGTGAVLAGTAKDYSKHSLIQTYPLNIVSE